MMKTKSQLPPKIRIYTGTINPHNPLIQSHARLLSERFITQGSAYSRAKIIYWLANKVKPTQLIEIRTTRREISSAHPGETRFLASVLKHRQFRAVLFTPRLDAVEMLNNCREIQQPPPPQIQTAHFKHTIAPYLDFAENYDWNTHKDDPNYWFLCKDDFLNSGEAVRG